MLYPGLNDDQCYNNLKGVLRRFYQRIIPEAQVRESFWNRSQGQDEPAHQYAADLKVFAEKAFPEMQAKDREMMIRRQFVAGLRNLEAGFKIMCDNVEKMDLCVQIAEYADDLNVIRDDLARRKTPNSSSIALPLSQPRPPAQMFTTHQLQRTPRSHKGFHIKPLLHHQTHDIDRIQLGQNWIQQHQWFATVVRKRDISVEIARI